MKVAVINFSGNVGKTTVARHLLAPRLKGAPVIEVESINSGEGFDDSVRGTQYRHLQEFVQTRDDVVVDVGASNVEQLLSEMRKYDSSHDDYDFFVVPTVPAVKQQRDTVATLAHVIDMGIPKPKLRLVFNQVDDLTGVESAFGVLLRFVADQQLAAVSVDCKLGTNEIYELMKGTDVSLAELAQDETNYKALIAKAPDIEEKVALARRLAIMRLARGVVPELDRCFAALVLQ